MRIHGFALLLLLGSATIAAAPPAAPTPVDAIDVDAMARAKDVKNGATEAATSAPAGSTEAVDGEPSGQAALPSGSAAPSDTPPSAPDGASSQQDTAEADPVSAPPVVDEAATDDSTPAADAGDADAAAKQAEPIAPTDDTATENATSATEPVASEAAAAERRGADACIARAGALLDAAQARDFEKATRDFDAKMRGALTDAQLQQKWESLAQFGKLTARGQSHPGMHEGYVVVTIPLVFEKANLYAQVSCGSDGRIAGFYVKPLQLPAQ